MFFTRTTQHLCIVSFQLVLLTQPSHSPTERPPEGPRAARSRTARPRAHHTAPRTLRLAALTADARRTGAHVALGAVVAERQLQRGIVAVAGGPGALQAAARGARSAAALADVGLAVGAGVACKGERRRKRAVGSSCATTSPSLPAMSLTTSLGATPGTVIHYLPGQPVPRNHHSGQSEHYPQACSEK